MAENYKAHHEELGSIYVPKTIAQILLDVSMMDDFSKKIMILEFHIQALEGEMRHIGASEHPHLYSIHFLEDAIEILKKEIIRWKRTGKSLVVREVMPSKSGFEECCKANESKDINKKKEWMSTFQLWTTPVHEFANNFGTKNQNSLSHNESSYKGYRASSSGGNFNHKDGAFMPYKSATTKNKGVDLVSSSTCETEVAPIDMNSKIKDAQLQPEPLQKKQRRCWTPELHQQFVDALQQLGGIDSLATTPKQIKEMMRVNGLTNNEVKSHLQKYRIFIRKPPSPS